ncbi:MAG: hypothetical protein WDO14_20185 [Bacteroidota bacterium]
MKNLLKTALVLFIVSAMISCDREKKRSEDTTPVDTTVVKVDTTSAVQDTTVAPIAK